jgi:hypothetical protein
MTWQMTWAPARMTEDLFRSVSGEDTSPAVESASGTIRSRRCAGAAVPSRPLWVACGKRKQYFILAFPGRDRRTMRVASILFPDMNCDIPGRFIDLS